MLKAYGAICVIGNYKSNYVIIYRKSIFLGKSPRKYYLMGNFSEKFPVWIIKENIINWFKCCWYVILYFIITNRLKKCIRKHAIKQVTEGKMN